MGLKRSWAIAILAFQAFHLQGQAPPSQKSAVRLASSLIGRRSTERTKARVDAFKRPFHGRSDAQFVCGSTFGNTETNNPVTCTGQIQVPQGATSLPIEVAEVAAVAVYQQTCGGGGRFCGDALTLTISGPDGAVLFAESLSTNGGALPGAPNPPFVLDMPSQYPQPSEGCGQYWTCYNRVFGGSLNVGQYTANGPAAITITQTYIGYGEYDTSGLVLYIPSLHLVDPVPDLVNADGTIIQEPESLATLGTPVVGVTADGAARLLLRVPLQQSGARVQLTVFNDQGEPSSSPVEDGLLTTMDGTIVASQIQVTAVNTDEGPMAFALYFPPTDFVRQNNANDTMIYQRPISIQADFQQSNPTISPRRPAAAALPAEQSTPSPALAPLYLRKRMIFLIHGLWGAKEDFSSLQSALIASPTTCPNACVANASYNVPTAISSPVPPTVPTTVSGAALGFAYNAPIVLSQLKKANRRFYRCEQHGLGAS